MSPGSDSGGEDMMHMRKLSVGAVKQRHVSSQTITQANFQDSLEEQESDSDSDKESDMSDIAEEAAHERNSSERKDERAYGEQAGKKKVEPVEIDVFVENGEEMDKALDLTSPTTTQMVQM
jgi:hypothetical protein